MLDLNDLRTFEAVATHASKHLPRGKGAWDAKVQRKPKHCSA